MKHQELTGQIIQSVYKVHNTLGFGFLESVYQNALLEVGLLINFGERAVIKRKVFTLLPADAGLQK